MTRRFAALALAVALAGPGWAADVFVGTPAGNPQPGQQIAIDVAVDVGARVLGSYFVRFTYDPTVVRITALTGGTTMQFAGPPVTDVSTFTTGTTPFAASQPRTDVPSGFVGVATITLLVVGAPGTSSPLALQVVSLFDAGGMPLAANVFPTSVLVGFDPTVDPDGDGLTNDEELAAGTNFSDPDSDDDGLSDGFEVGGGLDPLDGSGPQGAAGDPDDDGLDNLAERNGGCNPTAPDTDGDGLRDDVERSLQTLCANPDTDGDGLPDGFEVDGGLDPLDNGAVDPEQGAAGDPDGDGLTNAAELAARTRPTDADSDDDGLLDGFEVEGGLDPLDDGSGVVDNGPLGDPDADGLDNAGEHQRGSRPNDPDTDDDGLRDGDEVRAGTDVLDVDSDDDGLADGCDPGPLDDGSGLASNGPAGDADGDTLPNLQECTLGTNPRDSDSDGDGLGDGEELARTTDPLDPDTDGDGMPDGYEVAHQLDPLDDGDGNVVNGPAGDPDADGFPNLPEARVGSDARDFRSRPALVSLPLRGGFAPILYPPGASQGSSALGVVIGGHLVSFTSAIRKLDAGPQTVVATLVSGSDFLPVLTGPDFPLARGEGVLATVTTPTTWVVEAAVQCPTMDLAKGVNVLGLPCFPPAYSAFQLLTDLGTPAQVSAVQTFDQTTGRFRTATWAGGVPAGSDFAIRAGEAYLVHMHAVRTAFDPLL